MTATTDNPGYARRDFLKWTGAGAMALTLVPFPAAATPEDVNAVMGKLIGGARVKEDADKFTISLPEIAENGAVVALGVAVDSPMTADDHIRAIHIFAEGNPLPDVASYHLGPYNGKADIALRIRLAKTQKIVFCAVTSKGEALVARRMVKVTLGGCGG